MVIFHTLVPFLRWSNQPRVTYVITPLGLGAKLLKSFWLHDLRSSLSRVHTDYTVQKCLGVTSPGSVVAWCFLDPLKLSGPSTSVREQLMPYGGRTVTQSLKGPVFWTVRTLLSDTPRLHSLDEGTALRVLAKLFLFVLIVSYFVVWLFVLFDAVGQNRWRRENSATTAEERTEGLHLHIFTYSLIVSYHWQWCVLSLDISDLRISSHS